jgi:Xaa-Pro aminopeptidase
MDQPARPDLASDSCRHALYRARLAHVRALMRAMDAPALLDVDPTQILYLTGARNMTLVTVRMPSRALLVFAEGPAVLYEYTGCEHLARGLPTIDEIRTGEGLDYVSSGGRVVEASQRFARIIRDRIDQQDPSIDRLWVGRLPFPATDALRAQGFRLEDAGEVLMRARMIKVPEEIPYMREAIRRVEIGVHRLEDRQRPDMSETEIWAEFHYELMAKEGQYVVTRLLQGGPNTFPYFQEAGPRRLQPGELLCLDTDAIGYEGYACDFSRTFLCGDVRASDAQKLLYGRAREQLETNAGLLAPGRSFRELAERAWPIPDEHQASRYYVVGHGLGMAGEFPNIPHLRPGTPYPLEGCLEPGMVICLESYIGWEASREGVKLEDQFLILPDRVERMSTYPFCDRLQTRMV